jgi:hypothetical protein
MSVWAFDGRYLAADRAIVDREVRYLATSPKIAHLGGTTYVALAGDAGVLIAVLDWIRAGMAPDDRPEIGPDISFSGLRLRRSDKDGLVHCWVLDRLLAPIELVPPLSGGTGGDLALGAMLAGASAVDAVAIACERDVWSAGPIDYVDITEPGFRQRAWKGSHEATPQTPGQAPVWP